MSSLNKLAKSNLKIAVDKARDTKGANVRKTRHTRQVEFSSLSMVCGGAPWAPVAPCQIQAALPGFGSRRSWLFLRSSVLLGTVAKRPQLLDTACSVCRHITLAYATFAVW